MFGCPKCKDEYKTLIGNFYKNSARPNGHSSYCISCDSKINRDAMSFRAMNKRDMEHQRIMFKGISESISNEAAKEMLLIASNIVNRRKFTEDYSWQDLKILRKSLIYFK